MSEKSQKVFTFSHFRALSFTLIDNQVVMKMTKTKKGCPSGHPQKQKKGDHLDTLKNNL